MYILCQKCKGERKLKLSKSEVVAMEGRGWNWPAGTDPKYAWCSKCEGNGQIRILSPTEQIVVDHCVET